MQQAGRRVRLAGWLIALSLLLICAAEVLKAQSQGAATAPPAQGKQDSTKHPDQDIPDAPSTVQPAKPLPSNPPPSQAAPSDSNTLEPGNESKPAATPDADIPNSVAPPSSSPAQNPTAAPPINIRAVPQGGATKDENDMYTLPPVVVNQVLLPVTVTDEAGHLVNGLTYKDFSVVENGQKQKLNFFTSSPFAVSAAVVLDLGMKDVDLEKVQHTFPALEGAFSEFDELSVYTYSNTVGQLTGWGAVGPVLSARLEEIKNVRGQNNGPPVTGGPLASQGPIINGVPVDPSRPRTIGAAQPARVLNDAILRAATDLAKRDKTRRKIIFVISDGREYRSNASYQDVLRVLLSNNIMVYAVGVGAPGVPGYSSLARLHLPRFGYTDILPRYVNATTGGPVFNELTRSGIEDAYAEALGYARNQYTMGYVMPKTPASSYRSIEVLVDRPSCKSAIRPCVNVYARDGYYPTPPTPAR